MEFLYLRGRYIFNDQAGGQKVQYCHRQRQRIVEEFCLRGADEQVVAVFCDRG